MMSWWIARINRNFGILFYINIKACKECNTFAKNTNIFNMWILVCGCGYCVDISTIVFIWPQRVLSLPLSLISLFNCGIFWQPSTPMYTFLFPFFHSISILTHLFLSINLIYFDIKIAEIFFFPIRKSMFLCRRGVSLSVFWCKTIRETFQASTRNFAY